MIVTCYSTFVVVLAYKLPNYYYLDSASHRTLCTIYRVSFSLLTLGVCFLNKHHHLALNIPSIINHPHLLACAR